MAPGTVHPVSQPSPAIRQLTAELERRFVTARTRITLTDRVFEVLHPRSAEDLIDEADFVRDERLPYWAEIWPSGVILAEGLSGLHGEGLRLLELGSGIGLVSIAAVLAGFEVLATDYYEDALRFTRVNVAHNTGVDPATRLVDWRTPPADLGAFDLIVASDVLYEQPYADLIADLLPRVLAPAGRALIADPGRVAAPHFRSACTERGLTVQSMGRVPYEAGAIRQTIDVMDIARA